MNLVFMGKQGVGKGTYAQRVSEKYDIPQISTGDLLRAETKSGSELGKRIESKINKGELIDDNLVAELIENRMRQSDAIKGFILDGFPRTAKQAELLDGIMQRSVKKIDMVMNFVATDKVLLQRLTGRRQCTKCGRIYHLVNIPPQKEGFCDIDGAPLFQREDDKEEAIRKRWQIYEEQTKPVLEYYKKQKKVVEVKANDEVAKIMPRVEKILDKLGA